MRVAIGSDHAGFALKEEIGEKLRALGHDVTDVGAHSYVATDDYPDFAEVVGKAVLDGRAERGVLICGRGVGASGSRARRYECARAGFARDWKRVGGRLGAQFFASEFHGRREAPAPPQEGQGVGGEICSRHKALSWRLATFSRNCKSSASRSGSITSGET